MQCDRPFCARMPIQNCRHIQLVRRQNASAARCPIDEVMCALPDMATTRQSVSDQNTEHAAGQPSETLGASNAVSTNARTNCKGAIDLTGHNKTNCRETMDRICSICEACGSSKCQNATNFKFQCPEHTRTKRMQRLALSPKGRKLHITRRKLSTVPVWAAPTSNLPPGRLASALRSQ
jgi:hypothetical protein